MDRASAADATFAAAGGAGWRVIGDHAAAWFETGSYATGAALIARIAASIPAAELPEFDLRPRGLRVRVRPDPDRATTISATAAALGLRTDPAALAELGLVIQTGDAEDSGGRQGVRTFWRQVLAYRQSVGGGLADPLHRDPPVRFTRLDVPRPLRNRLHLDVGRPAAAVDAIRTAVGQQPHGPFQVALDDPDGNEVDLCPGGPLSTEPGTDDWQAMFSALAFYPAATGAAVQLLTEVAGIADAAGLPLSVDLRPDGVLIDSGKDQWETATGADPAFVALAMRIQQAAAELGLASDPAPYRFIQIGIDVADIPAAREFWRSVLGYRNDPRPWVTDIYDPRRLNPVIFFQDLDTSDADRVLQRNRLHLEVSIPAEQLDTLLATGLAAGGRRLDPGAVDVPRRGLADPEGNELWLLGY
ncbi:hypothetical protein GCM10011575_26660 [Microlunatus endophyticus]|uniref:Glyoxalase-like domain-containing protein n=1 Tax=Microlunatus endophyticus TaxID=1716077 RepID=A0A917SA11_9ACTN|nr:VOC family protein [Microlunatus endophyticus]GGL66834.1 hypothetical protein GCM10011575_26660 [Microlunatus endophyticus]